jgi:1-acyl-sn-glycerol-3-phosphate acyltransferase
MKKIMNAVVFFLFTYPVGIVIGLVFWFFWLTRVMEIRGWENFPKQRGKVLVVSNHPYKGEQVLLTGLFFRWYLFRPWKYGPWSLADRKNYYDKYPLLRPRLIPVDRTRNGDPEALNLAKSVLSTGANIILFPEGGRTSKGQSFLTSRFGARIRPLKGGFAILAAERGTVLVPVWFEHYHWYDIILVIGESICFSGITRREIVERTEKILLELADKAG